MGALLSSLETQLQALNRLAGKVSTLDKDTRLQVIGMCGGRWDELAALVFEA